MTTFTVDVWISTTFPVNPDGDGFHRFVVSAPDGTSAELIACQMAASHPGHTPVRSVVLI
jgi:hypothetical protein